MTAGSEPLDVVVSASGYDVTVIMSGDSYRFAAAHRCRAGACLLCRKMIGGEAAVIVTAVALNDTPCLCGAVESDAFLLHASHLPLEPAELQAAIARGLECPSS